MPLRHVLGRGDAERRHLLFRQIVGDRQRLEGGQRADQAMDVVLLDQLLSLGAGGRGNAGGVGNDQLDLAAGEGVVARLQEHGEGEIHVDAAGGQRPGLGREQADADRAAVLRQDDPGRRQAGDPRAGDAADKLPSRYRHGILPELTKAGWRFFVERFIRWKF
jgi:hypothetical protein